MLNANYSISKNAGSSRSMYTEVREVFETWILSIWFFHFMFCNWCTTVTYCMNIKQEKARALWELSARWECVRIAWLTPRAARITAKLFPSGNAAGESFNVWMLKRELNIPEKNTHKCWCSSCLKPSSVPPLVQSHRLKCCILINGCGITFVDMHLCFKT